MAGTHRSDSGASVRLRAVGIPSVHGGEDVNFPGVITLSLKADGDKLEGTFTLPDKTVLRRITLKKSE